MEVNWEKVMKEQNEPTIPVKINGVTVEVTEVKITMDIEVNESVNRITENFTVGPVDSPHD